MPPTPAKKLDKDYDDWQGQDAMRTLQAAEDVKSKPGLHKAAIKHAKKQVRSLKKIAASKPMAAAKR